MVVAVVVAVVMAVVAVVGVVAVVVAVVVVLVVVGSSSSSSLPHRRCGLTIESWACVMMRSYRHFGIHGKSERAHSN